MIYRRASHGYVGVDIHPSIHAHPHNRPTSQQTTPQTPTTTHTTTHTRQAVVDELRGEVEKLERAGTLALRIQTLHTQEPAEKREGDAKAWTEFVATRLVPRLKRDRERVGAGGYTQEGRLAVMRAANPTFVLRNWVAQDAIEVRVVDGGVGVGGVIADKVCVVLVQRESCVCGWTH